MLDDIMVPGLDLVNPNGATGGDGEEEVVINFVFPSDMRVTMEPHLLVSWSSQLQASFKTLVLLPYPDWSPGACGSHHLR
jgi:hypothetical protein